MKDEWEGYGGSQPYSIPLPTATLNAFKSDNCN